jgi:hypothetical protein
VTFTNQIVPSATGLALLGALVDSDTTSAFTDIVAQEDPEGDVSIYQSIEVFISLNNGAGIANSSSSVAFIAVTWFDADGTFLTFENIQVPSCGNDTSLIVRVPVKGSRMSVLWGFDGADFTGPVTIIAYGSYRVVTDTSITFFADTGTPNVAGANGDHALYMDASNYAASQTKTGWTAPWQGRAQLIFRSSGTGTATVQLQYFSSGTATVVAFYREIITGANTVITRDIVFPGGCVFVSVINDATAKGITLSIVGG